MSQEQEQSSLLWPITMSTKKTTNKKQSVTKYVADGKRRKKCAKVTIAPDWIAYPKNKSKKLLWPIKMSANNPWANQKLQKKFYSRGEERDIKTCEKVTIAPGWIECYKDKSKVIKLRCFCLRPIKNERRQPTSQSEHATKYAADGKRGKLNAWECHNGTWPNKKAREKISW